MGIVGGVDADEPVGVRPLGVLVQDGIEDVPVDLIETITLGQINDVVAAQRDRIVVFQIQDSVDMVPHIQVDILGLLDLGAAVPADHDEEDGQGDDDGHVAADEEFAQAGDEEHAFEGEEDQTEGDGGQAVAVQNADVDAEEDRHHQHADGDGQAVSVLYAGAGAEVQDHRHAEDPQHVVDEGDVDLAFGIRGVAHVQVGHQVQAGRLVDQRIAAADQGLAGDDGGHGAEQDGQGPQTLGQHHVEGVEVPDGLDGGIALVVDDPHALAHVVQDQADLDERPADVDAIPAHMAHIRIQGFRAGGAQEHAAQDHEARFIVGAEQDPHGVDRVEGPQDGQVAQGQPQAGEAQEQEPDHHHRPEHLADGAGAAALDQEQDADDGQCYQDHRHLARAQQFVHGMDAAQAFHGGGDGDGRGQHAVRQHGAAADHGGDDQPLAAVADQAVEGEDAALVMIVRPERYQHVLHGGQQGDGPDDQGQRTDDELLVHVGDAAVALDDGLHHVHGGRADIAVDDAQGHQEHPHAESLFAVSELRLRHAPCSSPYGTDLYTACTRRVFSCFCFAKQ